VRLSKEKAGDVVLSHTISRAVPSALRGLTTVFGMGTGVTLAAKPPTKKNKGLDSSLLSIAVIAHANAHAPDVIVKCVRLSL
jgi:hypothetical protein